MGEERYTPTRLEWVVVNIQSKFPMLLSQLRMLQNLGGVDDIRVFFEGREPDTVRVIVRYLKGVDGEVVRLLVEEIKRDITDLAKHYGWESWLKVEVDLP